MIVAWRGAGGKWSKWHYEREEYPHRLFCRATVADRTVVMRKLRHDAKDTGEICLECWKQFVWEQKGMAGYAPN